MGTVSKYLSAVKRLVGGNDVKAAKTIVFWHLSASEQSKIQSALSDFAVSEILSALARLLGDDNFYVRGAAASVIGHLGAKAATPEVVTGFARLLTDYKKIEFPNNEEAEVGNTVLSAVARFGPKALVPQMVSSLVAIFVKPGGCMARNVAEAIGSLCAETVPPEILSSLGQLLADPLGPPERAVKLLSELGAIAATPENLSALARMLSGGQHQLAVLEALERLGKIAATPEILEALKSAISEAKSGSQENKARLAQLEAGQYYATESGREIYGLLKRSLGHHDWIRSRATEVLRVLSEESGSGRTGRNPSF